MSKTRRPSRNHDDETMTKLGKSERYGVIQAHRGTQVRKIKDNADNYTQVKTETQRQTRTESKIIYIYIIGNSYTEWAMVMGVENKVW